MHFCASQKTRSWNSHKGLELEFLARLVGNGFFRRSEWKLANLYSYPHGSSPGDLNDCRSKPFGIYWSLVESAFELEHFNEVRCQRNQLFLQIGNAGLGWNVYFQIHVGLPIWILPCWKPKGGYESGSSEMLPLRMKCCPTPIAFENMFKDLPQSCKARAGSSRYIERVSIRLL